MSVDHAQIYEALESTMRRLSSPPGQFDHGIAEFMKRHGSAHSKDDEDYYWRLVQIAFYSGMNADVVSDKLPAISKWFDGYKRVAAYGEREVRAMMRDASIIRHEKKIRGSVANAKAFKEVVESNGSFAKWVASFDTGRSFDNVLRFRDALRERFAFLGRRTVYHFMTDIGLPVLKPDRVVMRIFHRLGLISSRGDTEGELRRTIDQGRLFAEATGKPIREIDIAFVSYGQVGGNTDLGLDGGVCLEERPRCELCGLQSHCSYFSRRGARPD
jgi:DNA-3-methyladenine glycosylase I